MFQNIIEYAVRNKLIVFLMVGLIVVGGLYSMNQIPLDAVPDITTNQVQVVTVSPTLAAEEVEQLITFPIEASVSNIPDVTEIRSISRYGLSVITVVFEEDMPMLDARQYVKEQLGIVEIPPGMGTPELMPITTGLGEIYQYVLQVKPGYEEQYDAMELRTIQDWIVKRQMAGIPGIIEVSSFGGFVKQYEVSVNAEKLYTLGLTLPQVLTAIEQNNENSGGSYIEDDKYALYIRTFGRLEQISDIEKVVVGHRGGIPIYVKDIGHVKLGAPQRYGAMTMDGKGEVVGGITLMLKGSNSSATITNVQERIENIQSALPEGVEIYPYLDRASLISRAINTVKKNLIEGGLIVIFVLVLLLGNWRGGVIVASVIPLSMLFAFMLMHYFGVSANLMSLGALDFGIVVDGAVIIVESVLHVLYTSHVGKTLSRKEMDDEIIRSSGKIYNSAAFGVLIILVVFVPIMTLTGTEGKMFRPMAFTVSFAILGAMILSLTYVPVVASLLLKKEIRTHDSISDKIVNYLRSLYKPSLEWALRFPKVVIATAVSFLLISVFIFSRMGGEFIPTLEEGDLAMQMAIQPGSSLTESTHTSTKVEKILLENFPEVKHVVSKIGTSEVPTDPMAMETGDIMIILEEKDNWVSTDNREDLVAMMKEKLSVIVGATFEFTQPIQLRFNELTTGTKSDVAIQIYGENMDRLVSLANQIANAIKDVNGIGDMKVEQTQGLPQMKVSYDRDMLGYYGISVHDVNTTIKTAYAGSVVGQIFENERQFDLVVRYDNQSKETFDPDKLWVASESGKQIPVSKIAKVEYQESPLQISREDAKRRIGVGVNVRNRDVASLVEEIKSVVAKEVRIPAGYIITYGGQFENLEQAQARLKIAVPLALISILVLLYFTFKNVKDSLVIFMAVPFSAIGGVFALWLRGMPFSISAGVGFIALFGVAVLNGIVLIQYYHQLQEEGETSLRDLVIRGGLVRLRPVVMTAAVASLGFLPMAISSTAGAEVQRPLATVVIGGLVTSTFLTLIVLPIIYSLIYQKKFKMNKAVLIGLLVVAATFTTQAQAPTSLESVQQSSLENYGIMDLAALNVKEQSALKKQSYNPGNLSVNYSYGELNAGVNDYNINIMQPLGNIPQSMAQNKAMKMNVEMAEIQQELVKKQVLKEVTDLYMQWILAGLVYESFESQFALYEEIQKSAEKAVKSGNISALDVAYLRQEKQSITSQLAHAKLNAEGRKNQLLSISSLDSLVLPRQFPLLDYQGDTTLSSVFTTAMNQQKLLSEQNLTSQKLGYLPNFSVGYFNQQLEGERGFDGVMVGASIPLWFQPQSAKVQQQKIAQENRQVENRLWTNQLQSELQKCLASIQLLEKVQTGEHNPQETIEMAEAALQAGELNVFDFIRVTSHAFDTQRNAWQTQQIYLSTINELKYYTE